MTTIVGAYVPAPLGPAYNENCHAFACSYLGSLHRLPPGTMPNSPQHAQTLLWPVHGGWPARVNGQLQTQPGDIIGFWDRGHLMHSMVAVTKALWIGANNTSAMGVPGGRTSIVHSVAGDYFQPGEPRPHQPVPPAGWVGMGNDWRYAMGGHIVQVTRRPP